MGHEALRCHHLDPFRRRRRGVPPRYETPGAAGRPCAPPSPTHSVLAPGERSLIPTGIALALPLGYEAQVRARSGLALRHGLYLPNGPGTVDSDYRGEVGVILQNGGSEPFTVARERIAQLVIAPVVQAHFEPAARRDGERAGGFGSTGRQ